MIESTLRDPAYRKVPLLVAENAMLSTSSSSVSDDGRAHHILLMLDKKLHHVCLSYKLEQQLDIPPSNRSLRRVASDVDRPCTGDPVDRSHCRPKHSHRRPIVQYLPS